MDFEFDIVENREIEDNELMELLTQVYVDGGFTKVEDAKKLFESNSVRDRGFLLGIRERQTNELAGVIILVQPESKARRLAKDNESEMQLLAVKEQYRRHGLAKKLVEKVILESKSKGHSKMVLWTQQTMIAAQRLYESFGFLPVDHFEKNGREFIVYSLML